MKKVTKKKITIANVTLLLLATLSINTAIYSQNTSTNNEQTKTTYRDRLVEFSNIYSYKIDPNTKDTLLYTRMMNEFWFGVFGGPNINMSFGSLFSKTDPTNENNVIFNKIVDFKNRAGYGYAFGIMGEWTRLTSHWSGGLKIAVYDKKITRVGSDEVQIILPRKFDFYSDLSYIIFTPFVKYSFPDFDGFYVSGGIDVAVIYNTYAALDSKFKNTGDILHRFSLKDVSGKTRFTGSLGCGYDFFIADFFGTKSRVRITPFVDFKMGTNIITDNGSSWNDMALNFGLQFKLAPDVVKIDTLRYDPEAESAPVYIATVRHEDIGVEFPKFTGVAVPPAINLAMIVPEVEVVVPPAREEPDVAVTVPDPRRERPTTKETRTRVRLNDTSRIHFAGAASTSLTQAHKAELDEIARFLKENPNTMVRFIGHSAEEGTPTQQAARADARANNAMNYLISQGIPRSRIFATSNAARNPIATNDTEAGRRQNRRLEYVIQRGG